MRRKLDEIRLAHGSGTEEFEALSYALTSMQNEYTALLDQISEAYLETAKLEGWAVSADMTPPTILSAPGGFGGSDALALAHVVGAAINNPDGAHAAALAFMERACPGSVTVAMEGLAETAEEIAQDWTGPDGT